MLKRCPKCKTEKPLDCFHINSRKHHGVQGYCKECQRIVGKDWELKNQEKRRLSAKKRWENNRINNTERILLSEEDKKNRIRERHRNYYLSHYERCRELCNKARRERRRLHPKPKTIKENINDRMRTAIKLTLNGKKNWVPWSKLVGYNADELIKHIEKHFLPGMSWENRAEWHIDHIIPVRAFNYEKPEDIDFKRCWSIKNLRPLWKQENLKKSGRLDKPFQPSLAMAC